MNKQKQQKRQFSISIWSEAGLLHETHSLLTNLPNSLTNLPNSPLILAEYIANLKVVKSSAIIGNNSKNYIASKLERLCKMPSSYTFDLVELRSLIQYNHGIKYSPFEFTSIVVSSSKLFDVEDAE
jgi:hypothetical protein